MRRLSLLILTTIALLFTSATQALQYDPKDIVKVDSDTCLVMSQQANDQDYNYDNKSLLISLNCGDDLIIKRVSNSRIGIELYKHIDSILKNQRQISINKIIYPTSSEIHAELFVLNDIAHLGLMKVLIPAASKEQ